jgi:DNA-binding NarL/FixJ family response regulator
VSVRVVVADDQEVVRKVLTFVLTEEGHEVVAAVGDGRDAYLQTHALQPDAIVLDVGMPHVDGITTLRLLRDGHPDLRIIVYTGYDDPALAEELETAGADAVIVKGTDLDPLLQALDEVARVR